ncbi:MAG: ATP synthase F1 subunit epsilon [Treponema sp.]|jgi:F-type H+-transporting ATPase subunit epsilon|nr:ATP synthase F1 subunit epsilon [Treponema sp.]
MAVHFPFEVHTPYRRFFVGQVQAITVSLVDGEITVYANHSFFTAPVSTGLLRIKDENGEWKNAFVTDGILEVKEHKTILMVDTAEWPQEIDRERAQASMKAAIQSLQSGILKFEMDNARASLRRARMRLKVADQG